MVVTKVVAKAAFSKLVIEVEKIEGLETFPSHLLD